MFKFPSPLKITNLFCNTRHLLYEYAAKSNIFNIYIMKMKQIWHGIYLFFHYQRAKEASMQISLVAFCYTFSRLLFTWFAWTGCLIMKKGRYLGCLKNLSWKYEVWLKGLKVWTLRSDRAGFEFWFRIFIYKLEFKYVFYRF